MTNTRIAVSILIVEVWILVGIVTVLTRAIMSPYQKELLEDFAESQVIFVRDSFALLFFVPVVLYITFTGDVVGTQRATFSMIASGFLNILGTFAIFAALNREDASIVIPLASFTPLLTSFVEPFFRQTELSVLVVAGGLLSAIGASTISSENNSLRSIVDTADKKAVLLALSSNLIYGFAATFDGVATSSFDPVFVSFVIIGFVWFSSVLRLYYENGLVDGYDKLIRLAQQDKGIVGVLQFLGSISTFVTFSLAPSAAQSTVLFQTSVVLTVVISQIRLQEGMFLRRLSGSVLILVGVALAVLH